MDFVKSKPFEYFEEEFDKFPYGLTRSYDVARRTENLVKNRYQGIYAYDETRVEVKGGGSDYINANFIDGYKKRKAYIASLGPMAKQMGDFSVFWNMIWQQKVETVVMVTNLDEEGMTKCEKYWPEIGATKLYGQVSVHMMTEEVFAEFTLRTLKIAKGKSNRTLHHLHFTAWPDRGIPEDVTAILELRYRVLKQQKQLEGPILVHCSAGIGRTGTYIALDILVHEGEAEGAVEIHGCVLNMRRNRVNMVQTAEQYEFLHKALAHALTMESAPISVHQFQMHATSMDQSAKQKLFKQLVSFANNLSNAEMKAVKRNTTLTNKNREGADIPSDENRPRLYLPGRSDTSDYINAVYMDSFKVKRRHIATQSPLSGTVQDFLTLIFQENCTVIVSFHDLITDKVGVFYPADNQVLVVGDFEVTTDRKVDKRDNWVLRTLSLKYKKDGREKAVTHIQYTDWLQGSNVPTSPASFIHVTQFVGQLADASSGPIVLHCLDGAKHCGLFCTVSNLLEKMEMEQEVSVVNEVRRVQTRRTKAIANMEQFNFCYECVLQQIGSSNTYSNVGVK
ncbi:receptor-type tyrosine-protein phosphatase kappa-like [Dreissena polymorpha]|uniref:receptor-type tyrosine-protein phosphatase kappa-like n=1 Tax=Dreissena polymorpha TaxID=45954 RepID=UPI0022640D19|nr:receptor-type tyrosine-protein phosphatase kappa-like [Dreissena polymorpha]